MPPRSERAGVQGHTLEPATGAGTQEEHLPPEAEEDWETPPTNSLSIHTEEAFVLWQDERRCRPEVAVHARLHVARQRRHEQVYMDEGMEDITEEQRLPLVQSDLDPRWHFTIGRCDSVT